MTTEELQAIRFEDWQVKNFSAFLKGEEKLDSVARQGPGEKYFTIGHGHYGSDVKPGQEITRDEAHVLLQKDIRRRIPEIQRLIPKFNTFPAKAQIALFGEYYRGSLGDSRRTLEHINAGRFSEAAIEFLDNDEYRNRVKLNRRGIGSRMELVSDVLNGMAK